MPEITFYRQARKDGGFRTAIELDGNTVFSRFDPGSRDSDPALLWYVDVRCQGRNLPRTPERAKQWLTQEQSFITSALSKLADDVPAGFDPGERPLERHVQDRKSGTRLAIVCSAARRVEARAVADVLRDLARNWPRYVQDLAQVTADA